VYGALVLVQLIFGLHYLTTSLIVDRVDAFEWTAIRILLAGILMSLFYRKRILNFPKGKDWYFLIVLSILGIILNTALFTKGLELTTPAHASLLSCMIPVMTLIFAWILGYEEMNRYKSLSLIIAMSGALILLGIDNLDVSSDLFVGDILVFINFTCFGLFLVLSKSMIKHHSPLGLSVLVMSIGAVLLLPLSAKGLYFSHDSWLSLPWWIYVAAFYSVLGIQYLRHAIHLFQIILVEL
jgi:drug/metabolite transporter (DMT)-like permease